MKWTKAICLLLVFSMLVPLAGCSKNALDITNADIFKEEIGKYIDLSHYVYADSISPKYEINDEWSNINDSQHIFKVSIDHPEAITFPITMQKIEAQGWVQLSSNDILNSELLCDRYINSNDKEIFMSAGVSIINPGVTEHKVIIRNYTIGEKQHDDTYKMLPSEVAPDFVIADAIDLSSGLEDILSALGEPTCVVFQEEYSAANVPAVFLLYQHYVPGNSNSTLQFTLSGTTGEILNVSFSYLEPSTPNASGN